jgi:hypothetical protein
MNFDDLKTMLDDFKTFFFAPITSYARAWRVRRSLSGRTAASNAPKDVVG